MAKQQTVNSLILNMKPDISEAGREHMIRRHAQATIQQRDRLKNARKALYELQDSLEEIMVMRELATRETVICSDTAPTTIADNGSSVGTPAVLPPFPTTRRGIAWGWLAG